MFRILGRISESQQDLREAAALAPNNADVRFELAEVELTLDNWEGFRAAIEEGFELSSNGKFGRPAVYCRAILPTPARVAALVDLYDTHGALAALGQGLVGSIPSAVDPDLDATTAAAWLRAWEEAGGGRDELVIPLRILAAAVAWKADQDDAHLLRLPAEERAILERLLRQARPEP